MKQKFTWCIAFLVDPKIATAFQEWIEENHFSYLFEMEYFEEGFFKLVDTNADGLVNIFYILHPKSKQDFEKYEKERRLEAVRRFRKKFDLGLKTGKIIAVLATGYPIKIKQ